MAFWYLSYISATVWSSSMPYARDEHSFIFIFIFWFLCRNTSVLACFSPQEFTDYTNLDECISYLCDYMVKNGPFDGLLGFSQVKMEIISYFYWVHVSWMSYLFWNLFFFSWVSSLYDNICMQTRIVVQSYIWNAMNLSFWAAVNFN